MPSATARDPQACAPAKQAGVGRLTPADLRQAKAIIAARIIAVLDERKLPVRKAAEATGFSAADFSRIRNASLGRFTLDRLMKILATLDGRIRVTVHVDHENRRRGREARSES